MIAKVLIKKREVFHSPKESEESEYYGLEIINLEKYINKEDCKEIENAKTKEEKIQKLINSKVIMEEIYYGGDLNDEYDDFNFYNSDEVEYFYEDAENYENEDEENRNVRTLEYSKRVNRMIDIKYMIYQAYYIEGRASEDDYIGSVGYNLTILEYIFDQERFKEIETIIKNYEKLG